MDTHDQPQDEAETLSVRAALDAAFAEAEAEASAASVEQTDAQPDPEAASEGAPADGRERDEQGRFAAKKPEAAAKAAPGATDQQPADKPAAQAQDTGQAPSSWNAEGRDLFAKADPKLRAYIHQRESEQRQGVEKLKAEYEPKAKWAEEMWGQAISPYAEMIQREGVTPTVAVRDLLEMAKIARVGTDDQKADLIANTIRDFRIRPDLVMQRLGGGQSPQHQHQQQRPQAQRDPAYEALYRELTGIKQTLTAQQQAAAQAQTAQLHSEIDQFKAQAPHFDQVRVTMGKLIENGTATDLKDAYDKAIRLHDEIWQQEQAAKQAAAQAERQQKAQAEAEKKRRAAGSVSGSPGLAGNGAAKPASTGSLRGDLIAAFNAVGRV